MSDNAPSAEELDELCAGLCVRASDVGVYAAGDPIAYPHDACLLHGREVTTVLDPTPYFISETNKRYSRDEVLSDKSDVMWNLADFRPRDGFEQDGAKYAHRPIVKASIK